jgi:hypothetical protein
VGIFRCFIVSCCIHLCLFASAAKAANPESDGLAERVLASSQLIDLVAHYPDAYQTVANTSMVTEDDGGEQNRIILALKESFDIEVIRSSLLQALASRYDQRTLKQLAEFLERPIVSAMLREERRVEEQGVKDEVCRYIAELENNPPSEQRINLLNALEIARHGTETQAETTIVLMESLDKAVEPLLDNKELLAGRKQAVKWMKENKTAAAADERRDLMLIYHFIYRSADDTRLREYLDLLQTEIAQTYLSFAASAVPLAIAETERRAAPRIATILNQRKKAEGRHPAASSLDISTLK